MKQLRKRIGSLFLALVMTLSLAVLPTTALAKKVDPPKPGTLADIVTLLRDNIDGEKAFDYLSYVYLGWRTTGGPWQNNVIKDFVGGQMVKAGYKLSDTDLSGNNAISTTNDFFYIQHDASTAMTWAPEYARLQIVSITPPAPPVPPATPAEAEDLLATPAQAQDDPVADVLANKKDEPSASLETDTDELVDTLADTPADPLAVTALETAKKIFDVESYAFDPTSAVYQAHYNALYDLGATVGNTKDFTEKMHDWIIKKGTVGSDVSERLNVFPAGKELGAARGLEAELNLRAHLPTNAGFNATAEEIAAVRLNPENAGTILKGKTGEVVYVGDVSEYTGDTASLAGKVLLCTSSNRKNFDFAKKVGAISVMTTAALEYYHNPGNMGDVGEWYGGAEAHHTQTEWYTDSARFAGGVGATKNLEAMKAGKPIVEWNISPDQFKLMKDLLDAENTVQVNVASLGSMYSMNEAPAEGQLTAIAEIKGAKYPDERVVLAAHVQEPSSNDNATGVGLNIELAMKMKQMIDNGTIARPDRTMTFLWGDEMAFSSLYLNAHPNEAKKIVCSIDLDMVGEDTKKTGGPMRIEKAPDPAAYYNYMLDTTPEDEPYLDRFGADPEGNFTRTPDSHTLWGAGNPSKYDIGGVYLNDLYMAASQQVITQNGSANTFEVDVCPFEGGSDHGKFLEKGIPAVLTWHFTDYVYHTTVDTLYMSSAQELKDVGVTSLATAYLMANPTEAVVAETMGVIAAAAEARFAIEMNNTARHKVFADGKGKDKATELAQEKEVLKAWGKWYVEAIESTARYIGETPNYEALRKENVAKVDVLLQKALHNADAVFSRFGVDLGAKVTVQVDGVTPAAGALSNISLANGDEKIVVKLEMPINAETKAALGITTDADWTTWAKSLTWDLTRDGVDPTGQDPDLYPNIYTGDALQNWRTWGDKAPYFTLKPATVDITADPAKAVVTLEASNAPFFGSLTGAGTRNAFGSFTGTYQLSARDGVDSLAFTELGVNIYDSYRLYSSVGEELKAIKAAAKAKGRFFEIHNYGVSEDGFQLYYVTLADTQASVTKFQTMNEKALTNPVGVQADIKAPDADYRVPFFMNNVHSDECPGSDSQLNILWTLATEDTITYNTLTSLKAGPVDMTQFDPKLKDVKAADPAMAEKYKFTGLGSQKYSLEGTKIVDNNGKHDASEIYNVSDDLSYSVSDLLDNLIILACPAENPDGITYNSRRNGNGFDLNRDASNQTQKETIELYQEVAKWNPVVFAEMHGYMTEFLVEPCTPPHEPNLEYDLLVDNFLLGAEAFGKAALGTMSKLNSDGKMFPGNKFWSYYTPLRDDFDPKTTTWSAWDDLCTNYGPSYAMLNTNAMGFTIETPSNNEASTRLLECGLYGLLEFTMENKADIYTKQLEFFQRGLTNLDVTNTKTPGVVDTMSPWYVDINNNQLAKGTWRIPGANSNYFPEYWVMPVAAAAQRDPADAYEMAQFLIRNGVLVNKLTADVKVGDVTYHAGDLVVNMYQAKRNYANAVLWGGADASNSGFPDLYSESVSNFPAMRGFNCVRVDVKDAFAGKLAAADNTFLASKAGKSQFTGIIDKAVVLSNGGQEDVRAVNELLNNKKAVGLITEGEHKGSFVMSYADYQTVANKYILVATGVEKTPMAHQIKEPTVFLAGRYDFFNGAKVATGYYSKWFANGYGYKDYANNQNNGDSGADVVAYTDQLHFKTTTDPTKATVVLGSTALNRGEKGDAAVAAVKAGTPYIATGYGPLSYLKSTLLKDQLNYTSLGMESLHYVTYPTDSLTTASYAADGDYITYSVNCAAITQVPAGAKVLIQAAATDSHIAGCCLTEDGKALDGRVEAFSLTQNGMDLTVLGNSIINRTHQQDDYRYVTNTIYSKSLSEERMSIAGVADEPIDVPNTDTGTRPNTSTTTVKNPDGSTTKTVTDKRTGNVTATTTYPNGVKAEVAIPKTGKITANVTLPKSVTSATVLLAIPKPGMGTVAKMVLADGTEEIVKWSSPTENGLKVTLTASGKLVIGDNHKTFTDVPDGNWAADPVNFVTSRELFQGTGTDAFSPVMPMSRAMLVTVLHRLQNTPKGGELTFADVAADTWYTDAVAWAADHKIVTGTGNGFEPEGNITRESLIVMLYRYAETRGTDLTVKDGSVKEFPDTSAISTWATDAMTWAVGTGILGGKDTGKLDPAGTASRAEVATILMRFVSL